MPYGKFALPLLVIAESVLPKSASNQSLLAISPK
jgi:hypothetical protein